MKHLFFLSAIIFLVINGSVYAAEAAPSAQQGILSMLPLFLILVFFMYFMIIRPQTKRAKDQRNLLANLQVGDEVLTSGGLLGKVEKISSDFLLLNITRDINVNIQKSSVLSLVPRGTMQSIV